MLYNLRKPLVLAIFTLVLLEGLLMGCAQVKLRTLGGILMQLVAPVVVTDATCKPDVVRSAMSGEAKQRR